MRSASSVLPVLAECTNENADIWVVRWDVQPVTSENTGEEQTGMTQYNYEEERFSHKPSFAEAVDAVIASGKDATPAEAVALASVLGEDVQAARKLLENYIVKYDSSEAVNSFMYGGVRMWLDKSTRVGLVNLIASASAVGDTGINIWYQGMNIRVGLEQASRMLSLLEVYAAQCYNVTQIHLKEVGEMENAGSVLAFAYKEGYPVMLDFNM